MVEKVVFENTVSEIFLQEKHCQWNLIARKKLSGKSYCKENTHTNFTPANKLANLRATLVRNSATLMMMSITISSWWSHSTQTMMIVVILMMTASYMDDDDDHHDDCFVHRWWSSLSWLHLTRMMIIIILMPGDSRSRMLEEANIHTTTQQTHTGSIYKAWVNFCIGSL